MNTTNLDDYNARALDFLARLGAQPAVAFHEHGVATAVRDALTEIGVSWRTDNFGNIIARIGGTDARKASAHRPDGPHGPSRLRDRRPRRPCAPPTTWPAAAAYWRPCRR